MNHFKFECFTPFVSLVQFRHFTFILFPLCEPRQQKIESFLLADSGVSVSFICVILPLVISIHSFISYFIFFCRSKFVSLQLQLKYVCVMLCFRSCFHNYRHRVDALWRLSFIPIFIPFHGRMLPSETEWVRKGVILKEMLCKCELWNGNYKTNKRKSLDCFHVIS